MGKKHSFVMFALFAVCATAFGWSAGAQVFGDFNLDGYGDVAIGVPFENFALKPDAGVVHVVYGTAGGLRDVGNEIWHQNRLGIADACEEGDMFGATLVVGDFDDDFYADLAIAAPGEETTGFLQGVVHVLYGSPDGLTAAGSQIWRKAREGKSALTVDEAYGFALTMRDFNGDGYSDLAAGIPGFDLDDKENVGAVDVIFGAGNGLSLVDRQFWHQDVEGVKGVTHANDRFGAALSAGDYDRDGFSDLAIGAPGDNPGGVVGAGVVHVLPGRPSGLTSWQDFQFQQGDEGSGDALLGEAESGDGFGSTLASGDFDGDGYRDLAIGVPAEDLGTVANPLSDCGVVHAVYGGANGLAPAGQQLWSANSTGILDDSEPDDGFGSSLVSGDFDNDGRDDLAIGTPGETRWGLQRAGIVHVMYGWTTGLHQGFNQVWHQGATHIADDYEANDRFGAAVSAGDVNRDGFDDLVIGVPGENPSFVDGAGAIHLIFGSATNLKGYLSQFWHQDRGATLEQCEPGDGFGGALVH